MKEIWVVFLGFWIGMIYIAYNNYYTYIHTWDNGVKEGRCIERGGEIHNVDGNLQCLIK